MVDEDDCYLHCCKLADLIKKSKVYDHGMAIQFFIGYVNDGETPKMALSLVKNELKHGSNMVKTRRHSLCKNFKT